jgi:hypothetical protein
MRSWKRGYPLEEIAEITELTIEEVKKFIPEQSSTESTI